MDFEQATFFYNRKASLWLDGDIGRLQVVLREGIMTHQIGSCNFTGTMWGLVSSGSDYVLECLAGTDPVRYVLDGVTASGTVELTKDRNKSGTRWKLGWKGEGYLVECQGTGSGQYRLLQVQDNQVRLAPKNMTIDGTVLWVPYHLAKRGPSATE